MEPSGGGEAAWPGDRQSGCGLSRRQRSGFDAARNGVSRGGDGDGRETMSPAQASLLAQRLAELLARRLEDANRQADADRLRQRRRR